MKTLQIYNDAKRNLEEFKALRESLYLNAGQIEISRADVSVYAYSKARHAVRLGNAPERIIEKWISDQLVNGNMLDSIQDSLENQLIEIGNKLKAELIDFLVADLGPTVRGQKNV